MTTPCTDDAGSPSDSRSETESEAPPPCYDRTERRAQWRWRNRYLDLVQTKPDYIIAPPGGVWGERETRAFTSLVLDRRGDFRGLAVELGSGSGQHLIARAAANPTRLFVGFELRFKRAYRTAEKAEKAGLKNLVILQHDARALGSLFPPSSLDVVYINFPDPWTKPQWKKHRILTPQFLASIAARLVSGGEFFYKTDHRESFDEVCNAMSELPFEIVCRSHDLYRDLATATVTDTNIPTEFEGLFRSQGIPINLLRARPRDRVILP